MDEERKKKFDEERAQRKAAETALLNNLKEKLPELEKLLEKVSGEWTYEDGLYRFYHHSFKVFDLQELTTEIYNTLSRLVPKRPRELLRHYDYHEVNKDFMQIYYEGTGRTFSAWDNSRWLHTTRPIVEAFLHTKYFLEMAIRSAKELAHLEEAPNMLPSSWAAFLYLFNMR